MRKRRKDKLAEAMADELKERFSRSREAVSRIVWQELEHHRQRDHKDGRDNKRLVLQRKIDHYKAALEAVSTDQNRNRLENNLIALTEELAGLEDE